MIFFRIRRSVLGCTIGKTVQKTHPGWNASICLSCASKFGCHAPSWQSEVFPMPYENSARTNLICSRLLQPHLPLLHPKNWRDTQLCDNDFMDRSMWSVAHAVCCHTTCAWKEIKASRFWWAVWNSWRGGDGAKSYAPHSLSRDDQSKGNRKETRVLVMS